MVRWEVNWDVLIVEVTVYVFLIWMKCGVDDVEDEMILIWSGGDVVSG